MSDIVAFLTARLNEDEAAAEAAQAVDPGPWTVEAVEPQRSYMGGGQWEMRADTNWRPGHGAATVIAADTNPLWEPGSYTSVPGEQCMTVPTAQHVARHDPARVLREVAAKRELIEDWRDYAERVARDDCDEAAGSAWAALSNVLVTLAGIHREHPDYAGDDVDDWTWPDDEARQVNAT